MPKLKTNRGAAKRFRATASGYKCRRTNRSHNLGHKTTKRKRHLRGVDHVDASDVLSVARMLNDQ